VRSLPPARAVLLSAVSVRRGGQTRGMDRTWIDRIIAATGWTRTEERHSFDWAATEDQLGTRLPADFKELAEVFGPGMFGEWLGLFLPVSYEFYAVDIVSWSRSFGHDLVKDSPLWDPYGLHPKPGGLLDWGFTPDGHLSFYWAVEGDDPDRWPVIVGYEDGASLDRYEHSTTEHVYRELTRVLDKYSEYNLQGFAPLDEPTVHDRPTGLGRD
jgi:hypothetical protein